SLCRSFHIENLVPFALKLMVVHEKLLQFPHEFLTKIPDMTDMGVTVVGLLNSDDAIVAPSLLFLALLSLNYTDDSAFQQTARKGGLIHENKNIGRIAVFSLRRRDKTEIVRKRHPRRQHPLEGEDLLLFIKCILIAASLGRFDNYLNLAVSVC